MDLLLKNKTIKILICVFIFISVVHILLASFFHRGLVIDGIWSFYDIISSDGISSNLTQRMRLFSSFISQFPVFFVSAVLKIKILDLLLFLFSLPLYLYPFLINFWQFKLAQRTKRYDIAILSLFMFVLGILCLEWYAIVECLIAVPLYLLLFHYLASGFEYRKVDTVWIVLLSIYCFYSHEFIGAWGILLFLSSFLYTQNAHLSLKTKVTKYFIGVSGLLSALLFWIFYFSPIGPDLKGDGGMGDFGSTLYLFEPYLESFASYKYFYFILLAITFYSLMNKKKLTKYSIVFIGVVLLSYTIALLVGLRLDSFLYLLDFVKFSICMRFVSAVFCVGIFLYIIHKDFVQKKPFYHIPVPLRNLFVTSLIMGIFASAVQIFWTINYKQMINIVLNKAEVSKSVMVDFSVYKGKRYYSNIFPPEYAPLASLFMTKNRNKDFIIEPYSIKCNRDYPTFYNTRIGYNKNLDLICAFSAEGFVYHIDIVNPYWDLSKVKKYMIQHNVTY